MSDDDMSNDGTRKFRDYANADEKIREFYRKSRQGQTLEYVRAMNRWYEEHERIEMPVWGAIMTLDSFQDPSDPDLSISNVHHLFQVAESIRCAGHPEWMQVTGLVHDLGKMLYTWGHEQPSLREGWGVVGDTHLVGCRLPDSLVYPEFNTLNPDMHLTTASIYRPGCGIWSAMPSWGHDEYLYRVLLDNDTPLSNIPAAMAMIRYHSMYCWHHGGAYQEIMAPEDTLLKQVVKSFNIYDLYSKEDKEVNIDVLRMYYEPLLVKWLGPSLLL
jgi:inositol oxygenase